MKKIKLLLTIIFLNIICIVIAQTKYKGTITDQNNLPLVGVSIISTKNFQKGTETDFDGKFNIKLNNPEVKISYIGFKTKIIILNSKVNTIKLIEDTQNLNEVVVTAYGSSQKKSLIGSATQVKNKVIKRTAAASFETALQGNTSGINVYGSGQPGGSSNVQIRGIGSINGLTQPLYVLDGVVINTDNNSRIRGSGAINKLNPLSTINSNNIESISVLKDAAAASLYGSRAANGVVLITTKKGKNRDTELTFNAEFGPTLNLTKEETITNAQFKELWEEGELHKFIFNKENSEFKRVYNTPTLLNTYKRKAVQNYESIYGKKLVNSDWLDAIYRNGSIQKYGLSARGGNEKTRFYLSGDYLLQEGTIIKSDYKRYSARLNLNNKTNKWLSIGMQLSASKSERNSGQYDGNYAGGLNPLYMARVLPQAAAIYNPKGYKGIADLPNFIEKNANPIGVIEVGKYANNEFRVRGNTFAEILFSDKIKFKTTLGIDHQTNEESLYDNKEFGAGGGKWNGVLYVSQGEAFQYNTSNILKYNTQLGNHSFGALIGFESQVSKLKYINNSGYDILDSEFLSSSGIGTLWSWNGKSDNYSLLSYLSQLNYNYNKKYYLGASFRRDGSSRLWKDARWGNFWSVSGGWILSEERFLSNNSIINHLKLRASYGTNGNLPSKNYASQSFFGFSKRGYGGKSGLSLEQIGNKNLSWELSKNFNVGLDGVLLNKINFSVEYFRKKTENLLQYVRISSTGGFQYQLKNYGEMINSGWEASLGFTSRVTKDFSWTTKLNTTLLDNKVTKLNGNLTPTYNEKYGQHPVITKVGESLNSFYLRDYAGVNKENGFAQYHVLKNGKRTGKITTNASEAGFGIFGKTIQDIQGGFYNQLSFKRLNLDILFTYGIGGKVYDRTAFLRDDDGRLPQFTNTKAQLNPWNPNRVNSNIPIRINGINTYANDASTRHLYNADYLKLRHVKLGYTFPSFKTIKGGSVYIQGDNLWLLTALNDYDPEAVSSGINFFQIPTSTSIVLGIQVKF